MLQRARPRTWSGYDDSTGGNRRESTSRKLSGSATRPNSSSGRTTRRFRNPLPMNTLRRKCLQKPLSARQIVLVLSLLALVMGSIGGAIFFYGKHRTVQFKAAQADAARHVEIGRDDDGRQYVVSITDPRVLREILEPLKKAEYFWPNHPRKEHTYWMKVHRTNSRAEEYQIFLDERGVDYDYVRVIHRSGNTTFYGSAFKAPGLRGPLILALTTSSR